MAVVEMTTEQEQATVRKAARWLAAKQHIPVEVALSRIDQTLLHEFRYALAMAVREEIRRRSRDAPQDIAAYHEVEADIMKRLDADPSILDPIRLEASMKALNERLDAAALQDTVDTTAKYRKERIVKYAKAHPEKSWEDCKAACGY